ncbi:MAG: 3-keto-5-aminohexanoate cleavage protein [Cohaesibacteraceae bacterium]|nr:3-keto-5-aminohexanoate cleavage protein [Cohaesibacteraceae bacterium]
MVAPNGARLTQTDHPQLPVSTEDIAKCALDCMKAGAAVMHMHVRNDLETHTLDVARYRDALTAVGEATENRLLVQVTTESVGQYTPRQQMKLVQDLQPEFFSIAISELMSDQKEEAAAIDFLKECDQSGIAYQLIVYSTDDLGRLEKLHGQSGLKRPELLFVLGRYTDAQHSSPGMIRPFLEKLSKGSLQNHAGWAVCAFGVEETDCLSSAIKQGGHIRVGFENNRLHADGKIACDNAERVSKMVQIARKIGRKVASPEYVRNYYLGT